MRKEDGARHGGRFATVIDRRYKWDARGFAERGETGREEG